MLQKDNSGYCVETSLGRTQGDPLPTVSPAGEDYGGRVNGKMWLESGSNLKVQQTEFHSEFDLGCEKKIYQEYWKNGIVTI